MDNWIVIYVSTLSNNVYMVQNYLESEGIETLLQNELMAQIYFNTIGGVRLLVNKDDYERSIELLHQGGYIEEETSSTTFSLLFLSVNVSGYAGIAENPGNTNNLYFKQA